jgi:ribosomal-protein-alanine N-acetyltransferase
MNLKALFIPFPTISTHRLLLRALRDSDLDDLYTYASDPEIDHFTPWRHFQSLAEARADLDDYLAEYEAQGMGAWGIEHRGDQRLIGIATFSPPHPHHRRVELGYTIARSHWGEGYATEAAQALVRFGFEQMKLVRIEAVCLPEHSASARVLQKIGMRYEGLLRSYQIWRGTPCDLHMYALTINDFKPESRAIAYLKEMRQNCQKWPEPTRK